MGLFDRVHFDADLDVAVPAIDVAVHAVDWQTKTLSRHYPALVTYRVTASRRLLKEEVTYEVVPETDRPRSDSSTEGFERPANPLSGILRQTSAEWVDTAYHGTFECHATIENRFVSLDVRFTDGTLTDVSHNDTRSID